MRGVQTRAGRRRAERRAALWAVWAVVLLAGIAFAFGYGVGAAVLWTIAGVGVLAPAVAGVWRLWKVARLIAEVSQEEIAAAGGPARRVVRLAPAGRGSR